MKNKNEIEKPETIIVTKDNFQSSLENFNNLINNKSFKYIIINIEISTSNPKIIETEGEIVFSEFTICNSAPNNKNKLITYIIPSIKFHRYTPDEISSFDSNFLSASVAEKNFYNFKYIYKSNSLSYESINKRKILENNLNLILKDGKAFNEENENKKSYNYFPKAVEILSKESQKKLEDTLKYFIKLNFNSDKKFLGNDKENDKKQKIYTYESKIYEVNYKLLIRLLNFKWNFIYENFDNDAYKLIVNEYRINLIEKKNKLRSSFKDFINILLEFLEKEKNESKEYKITIKKNFLDKEFFYNWKAYLLSEEEKVELIVDEKKEEDEEEEGEDDDDEEKDVKLKLYAEKSNEKKYENIIKFLNFLLSIKKKYKEQDEFVLENINYKKFNMKSLIPKKARKYFKFSYHVVPIIDSSKFILNKKEDEYLSKISYKKLLIHNKNDEEILFGYKIGEELKQLFEIKKKKIDKDKDKNKGEEECKFYENNTKEISLRFGKDLEILYNNKLFKKELNKYIQTIDFPVFKSEKDKIIIRIILIKQPDFSNIEFQEYFDSLLNIAKDIKKNYLLNQEIGVSYFYKYLFEKESINIYGTNLKKKLYFALKEMIINNSNDDDEEINKILNKVNIFDISYICMKNNINFYKDYLDKKFQDLSMTQKLAYIIQENKILRNINNLNEYKNKFYLDEKEKIENKLYINIEKNKFYDKCNDIMNVIKNKTDFTINDNNDGNFQINFIDPEKFNEINNISKKINNI